MYKGFSNQIELQDFISSRLSGASAILVASHDLTRSVEIHYEDQLLLEIRVEFASVQNVKRVVILMNEEDVEKIESMKTQFELIKHVIDSSDKREISQIRFVDDCVHFLYKNKYDAVLSRTNQSHYYKLKDRSSDSTISSSTPKQKHLFARLDQAIELFES